MVQSPFFFGGNMQSIVVLTQVEHNRAMRADHWKPPRLAWVFNRLLEELLQRQGKAWKNN